MRASHPNLLCALLIHNFVWSCFFGWRRGGFFFQTLNCEPIPRGSLLFFHLSCFFKKKKIKATAAIKNDQTNQKWTQHVRVTRWHSKLLANYFKHLTIEYTFYGPPHLVNLVGNKQNECSALHDKQANMFCFQRLIVSNPGVFQNSI